MRYCCPPLHLLSGVQPHPVRIEDAGRERSLIKGGNMKIMKITALLVLAASIPLSAVEFPDVEGWEKTSEVKTYTPDNLWEYINGAADQFIEYGFR